MSDFVETGFIDGGFVEGNNTPSTGANANLSDVINQLDLIRKNLSLLNENLENNNRVLGVIDGKIDELKNRDNSKDFEMYFRKEFDDFKTDMNSLISGIDFSGVDLSSISNQIVASENNIKSAISKISVSSGAIVGSLVNSISSLNGDFNSLPDGHKCIIASNYNVMQIEKSFLLVNDDENQVICYLLRNLNTDKYLFVPAPLIMPLTDEMVEQVNGKWQIKKDKKE